MVEEHIEAMLTRAANRVAQLNDRIDAQKAEIAKYKTALENIARTVKLDAFAFNELAAKVHEIALDALGIESIDVWNPYKEKPRHICVADAFAASE